MNKKEQIEEMAKVIRPILENRTDICFIPDLDKPIAEELLKHYQPKLPKDRVVLSREGFNDLKYAKIERDRLNKSVKYHQGLIEDGKLVASQEVEQALKETVEKILEEVSKHYGGAWLVELYEKFGVEIKE